MSLPQIVSDQEWVEARQALLVKEKEMTRARDALNTARRMLPMRRVEKDYVFDGPDGKVNLLDLFDGRRQLMIVHFMFDPEWEEGCSSCTAGADEMSDGLVRHVNSRDTTLVYVSRAPVSKLEAYKAKRGWTFRWYSAESSDFNYDFHVSFNDTLTNPEYNYRPVNVDPGQTYEGPGVSCFLRVEDEVFHTYSTYARGTEQTGGSYYFLDLTALGRQEDWEEPKGRSGTERAGIPTFDD